MTRILVLGVCAGILAGCDRRAPPSPAPQPSPSAEQIVGNERVGWDQSAATPAELASLKYLAYVDEAAAAVELQDVTCASTPAAAGFPCTARLPPLTPGAHSLALAAVIDAGGRLVESDRSSLLNVVLVGQATMRPAAPPSEGLEVLTGDGLRLRVSVVAEALDEPTDLAFAHDGRIFVAERAGRVRIVDGGGLLRAPAATLSDVVATEGRGLLSMALDPDFERTRFVYLVYTADSGFRLVRFRAERDLLIDRVVLLEAISPASRRPAAALRFGPDAKLYLGVDDGDVADAAGDLGSFSGKVLRLNADATTPADQAGGTPVFALQVHEPRGVDWSEDGALWILENELLQVVAADARPLLRGRTVARYALPEGTGATALAFYRDGLMPAFYGNLFIAGGERRDLLRLQFDPMEPARVVSAERLLPDQFDTVRALGVGRDGSLYFCSSTALMKLAPAAVAY